MHALLRKSAITVFLGVQLLIAAALAQSVGRIDFASGVVRIERGAQTLAGVRGTEVLEGDVVVTGPDTQVQIRMSDDAFLALRPNTRLTLDKYRFNRPQEEDGVIVSLAHGIMRAFTGAIAERSRERFVMKTPLATVGIRGSGNILAHLGDEGTVNHTITGAHSVTALDDLGKVVTVVTRPGQTVQVRPGQPPRFIATPSYIFAAASSAPPTQVAAATSGSTTSGGGGTGSGSGGDTSASGSAGSGGGGGGGSDTSSASTSSSTAAGGAGATATGGSGSASTGGGSATTSGLPGGTGASTGSSSPSSNVQTAVAPANVRAPGTVGEPGLAGNYSVGIAADVVNPTGGRAGIFATDIDPGYSNVTLDAGGFLTAANALNYRSVPGAPHPDSDLTLAALQLSGGSASDYFRNVEQNIILGRVQNASINVTGVECDCDATTVTRTDATAPGGLAFVAYNEAPLGVIHSYTGTTAYRLDGATRPMDARGNVGTVNSATLNANFSTQQLDFTFSLSVNNLVYNAAASGVYFDRARFSAYYESGAANSGLNVSCTGSGCAPAYRGAVNGAFAGDATTAWLAYHLFPADASDMVNGAIAFAAITAPQPRFQLPATGIWTMVLIDNYPASGPGFPAFSTSASAHVNFGTRRADFTITLDRILTPANVAAGFQAQSVTASGANLPILGIAFIAQTGAGTRPATLNVTCTGCGTAPPVGRFEGILSYVAPDQLGGNLNLYWYLTNNTSGTLGYDYTGSSYFGNAPGTAARTVMAASRVSPGPVRLTRLPEEMRGPLRPRR